MWTVQKYRPVRVKMTTLFSPQSSLLIVNLNHSQLAAAPWSTKQVSFARHRFCRKSDTNEVLLASSSSSSYLPPRSHVTPLHASRTLGETKEDGKRHQVSNPLNASQDNGSIRSSVQAVRPGTNGGDTYRTTLSGKWFNPLFVSIFA